MSAPITNAIGMSNRMEPQSNPARVEPCACEMFTSDDPNQLYAVKLLVSGEKAALKRNSWVG